jgi:hypothetical protein
VTFAVDVADPEAFVAVSV